MISEKNLTRKLQLLSALLEEHGTQEDEPWKKNAFIDAYSICQTISARIDAGDYENPKIRLRAKDNSDYSWYKFRDPKLDNNGRDKVTTKD